MLSMHESEQYLFEALRAGASSCSRRRPTAFSSSSAAAMRGEPFLYPAAVAALIRDYLARGRLGRSSISRELAVLKLIAGAYTSDRSLELAISRRT